MIFRISTPIFQRKKPLKFYIATINKIAIPTFPGSALAFLRKSNDYRITDSFNCYGKQFKCCNVQLDS